MENTLNLFSRLFSRRNSQQVNCWSAMFSSAEIVVHSLTDFTL
ncbi:MAG: hypothetical protein ACE365_07080 [Gammaproteobacteria bacterium]